MANTATYTIVPNNSDPDYPWESHKVVRTEDADRADCKTFNIGDKEDCEYWIKEQANIDYDRIAEIANKRGQIQVDGQTIDFVEFMRAVLKPHRIGFDRIERTRS